MCLRYHKPNALPNLKIFVNQQDDTLQKKKKKKFRDLFVDYIISQNVEVQSKATVTDSKNRVNQ